MKTRAFLVYADPGHAWVKVEKAFLERLLGTHWRKQFTCFSYERGDHVYLEEDEDAASLVKACSAAGIEPAWRLHHSNRISRIRSYAPLSPI
jgi:hypothetical protein